MFRVGNSHKCESCGRSNEQHEKRYKEIATIIQAIIEYDQRVERGEDPAEVSSTACQSLKAKPGSKSRQGGGRKNREEPLIRQLHGLAIEKQMSNAPNNEEKAAGLAKSKQGTLDQSTSSAIAPGVVFGSNLSRVAMAIYGPGEADPSPDPGKASRVYVDDIHRFQKLEAEVQHLSERRKTSSSPRGQNSSDNWSKLDLPSIQKILTELGISVPSRIKKERKDMLNKAAEAIYADIELVANEARETMKRCAAYWRFANKRTYNAMVRNNQLVNWETGEKLREDNSTEEED